MITNLPLLLVDFGDSELRRCDEYGIPIYDPVQPLVFAPTGRRYSDGTGGPNDHAANFVLNSAYTLGLIVGIVPPFCWAARQPSFGLAVADREIGGKMA